MASETLEVQAAGANLGELLRSVRDGHEVVLKENDTAVARLIPVGAAAAPRVAELHPGAIQIADDFDEPLPDEFWTGDE